MHWTNEAIIRSHWSAAILDVVHHYGADNIYISILESGSLDNSKAALRELDAELETLGVERSIELLDTTHENEMAKTPGSGWILTSRGQRELRRIPYLAGIRNKVMTKLNALANRESGRRTFDKILWLNDVIFTTEDVTTLLATRDGDYAAACSLDFSKPPIYYDTFALRDISGAKPVTQTWPFFLAAESRNAMILNTPVPVKSCWNGIVVFQAEPFYKNPPLQFRGTPDSLAESHLEGSECCLVHIDNELSAKRGVWLNPNVRVAYNDEANKVVNPENGIWPSRSEKIKGIWGNRIARWTGSLQRFLERSVVRGRVRRWRRKKERKEEMALPKDEEYCLINEMQVLVTNGWKHL
ncbi:glycosyltransferase family 69 protein [Oidiodendron maius Zn]|uniref:Glycosyltransferase family 69 protein n=1 Tax=Oidiodendron maius (strain Zn) TaxID=913774 RepID=A0A0C3D8D8_OIDMZ|nr:glycosyltransferase family 69 protein [Oidiodendron maius Zn]